MKRQIKKFTLLLLSVFILSASGFTLKVNADDPKNIKLLERTTVSIKDSALTKVSLEDSTLQYKDTDTVRLIVELEGSPIITYATKKGVKVNELDKVTRQNLNNSIANEQKAMKTKIRSKGIVMKDLNSFKNVLNGFSVETTFKNAKLIQAIDGVLAVSVAHEFERPVPDLANSKDIVNAIETWEENGYNGQGMVVAVIDTGLDPSHKDFILTYPLEATITQTTFEGFPGTYRTAKVPYGYNYMDKNQEILDLGPDASEHGMHVAGIVGANGDETNGGVKGVAPEVQLLAMKVFGNNPVMGSTFGDVIVQAIDDSVALGADVINMSLGSTASFVQEDDLEQVAVKNAMTNGVIAAISAGNSNLFGSGFDDPYTSNPDIGVLGAPGLASESIQVASIENTIISALALEFTYNGEPQLAPYIPAGSLNPVKLFPDKVSYLDAGLGAPADFTGKDFTGKIALIQRGTYDFVTKIMNAQNAGAIGVIVYNHLTGGEALVSMAYPDNGKIPAVFIAHSYGVKLIENIPLAQNQVEFNGNTAMAANPDAGKMSDFTSWGTTPNLDFKPDITAPGGNIWSTAQNDGYQTMSGTSMAAPHVAGGSALVLQKVSEEFTDLTGAAKVTMAKNLLMSTAVAHHDTGLYNAYYGLGAYNFTSPRRQGAGVMDLYAATSTPAVAYEEVTGESKVSLGEIGNTSSFTLVIENFSNEDVTYQAKGTVQTDLTDGVDNFLESQGVYIAGTLAADGPNGFWSGEFPITFSEDEITVPANSKVNVEVTIDLTDTLDWFNNAPLLDIFTNGTFIEGFVTLEDTMDNNPDLSIPYMGFYGEWDDAPVIDASIYDKENPSFYGFTSLAWYEPSSADLYFLGLDVMDNADIDNIAFSPDKNGVADNVIPVLSFLRNAKEFEVNILDAEGKLLRTLYKENFITKNYYDSGLDSPFTTNLSWIWDGTANNKLVSDGSYYYQIRSRIDFEDSEWQEIRFPVKVDRVLPIINKVSYDSTTNILTVDASDNFSGISGYQVLDNLKDPVVSIDGTFDLTDTGVTSKATLVVTDYAGNAVTYSLKQLLKAENQGVTVGTPSDPVIPDPLVIPVKEPKRIASGDITAPVTMVLYPEFFGTYNTNSFTIQGTIEDSSPIDYLKIDGQLASFKWDTLSGLWKFQFATTYADGYHSIDVETKDKAGNSISFAHKIFIDATKPAIEITEELPTETTLDKITVNAMFTDNLPSLKVRLNQNLITNISPDWSYFDSLPSATYTLSEEVELVLGTNIIVLEAEDDAGNVTTVTKTIIRNNP